MVTSVNTLRTQKSRVPMRGRHRAPRRRPGWSVLAYGVVLLIGTVGGQVAGTFL